MPVFAAAGIAGYYYGQFSLLIEARLQGERVRVIPRVYGRPAHLATRPDARQRRRRAAAERSRLHGARGPARGRRVRRDARGRRHRAARRAAAGSTPGASCASSGQPPPPAAPAGRRRSRSPACWSTTTRVTEVALDPPLLSALATPARERRRRVPLAAIPAHVQQAVLAIEDRRFYAHPGVDPIRMVGALVTNLRGDARVPGRREHDHAAARSQLLPDRADGRRAAVGPALDPAQAARAVHGRRARDAAPPRTTSSSCT